MSDRRKKPRHAPAVLSNEDEERVQAMIAADPDDGEASDEALAQAKPLTDALPDLAAALRRSAGGRPPSDDPKVPISIRLDRAVLEKFRATGPGWQSRINDLLRKAKV